MPRGTDRHTERDTDGESGGEHTPVWPSYIPSVDKRPHRTLCLWDGRRLLTEHGETIRIDTFADLCTALFALNAILFTGRIEDALGEWFSEALQQTHDTRATREHSQWCQPLVSPNSKQITGLMVHRHPRVVHIAWAGLWGNRAPEPTLLRDIRAALDLCGVGDYATPARLGNELMLDEWRQARDRGEKWMRHHRPPARCVLQLAEHAVGARKECYNPNEIFNEAWEVDRTNGYAAECLELPCGTARYCPNGRPLDGTYFVWWGQVYVRIREPLPIGEILPLAVWNEEHNEWDWPTTPGGYLTYAWSFEVEEIERRAREDGLSVEVAGVARCWYWSGSTRQLAGWAHGMDEKRHHAEYAMGVKAVADLIKCATVGGIGRLGLEYATYTVLPESEAQEGDEPVTSPALPYTGLVLRREYTDQGTPKHWHAYILARQNLSIYQVQRRIWAERGIMPVATNVDGAYYAANPEYGVSPAASRLGDYKRRYRGDFLASPVRGTVITPEKVATPGLAASLRRDILRYGEARTQRKPTARELARERARGELAAHNRNALLRLVEHYWQREARRL